MKNSRFYDIPQIVSSRTPPFFAKRGQKIEPQNHRFWFKKGQVIDVPCGCLRSTSSSASQVIKILYRFIVFMENKSQLLNSQ